MHIRVCAVGILAVSLAAVISTARADADGNPEAGKNKAGVCAACHGIDGNGGADPTWPKLAGQIPEYLVAQLKMFKSGARKNPIMNGMVAALSEQDMKDLAAYFASLQPKPGAAANKDLALAGQRLYRGGVMDAGVPACMSCHGPSGHGLPPRFPRLSGQKTPYADKQLLDFKAGRRIDSGDMMSRIAGGMTESQIRAVSEYLSGLHQN